MVTRNTDTDLSSITATVQEQLRGKFGTRGLTTEQALSGSMDRAMAGVEATMGVSADDGDLEVARELGRDPATISDINELGESYKAVARAEFELLLIKSMNEVMYGNHSRGWYSTGICAACTHIAEKFGIKIECPPV